jgi:uncharacterized protein DUF1707
MRAADADRQFVADRLRDALNEGRLSLGEYDERLKEAYAARTYGELDTLLHDLPAVTPPERAQLATTPPSLTPPGRTPPGPAPTGQPARRIPGWLLAGWGSWLTSSLICFVVWVLTSPNGYPWPVWVAGPWGAVLLARTVMAYASGDPQGYGERERREHEERRERERQRREERRARRRARGY